MSKTIVSLNTAQTRKLIKKVLPTDPEFDAFCLDYFPSVKRLFPTGMDRLTKENFLLESVEPTAVLEKLQIDRPDEFQAHILRLLDAGEIKLTKSSPWPAMSPEAEEYMNQLKDLYVSSGFPFCESWAITPGNEKEEDLFRELTAHEIFEPFMMNSWKLTYYGMSLILDAVPLTEKAEGYLRSLSVEYQKNRFPNYRAWAFEMNGDLEIVANELRARGVIEPFTFALWTLTGRGKDIIMRISSTSSEESA